MTMTSVIQTLPVEVLSIIIDAVAEADEEDGMRAIIKGRHSIVRLPNVKACSLTSGTFLPLCRKHIFRRLVFRYDRPTGEDRPSRATLFLNLLSTTPFIAHYVQILFIHFWIPGRPSGGEIEPCTSLPSVLQKLSAVTSIELSANPEILDMDWQAMPPVFQRELFRVMRLPTVTSFNISGFYNFTLSSLAQCKALRMLCLRYIKLADIDEISEDVSPSKPIRLTGIEIKECCSDLLPRVLDQRQGDGELIFSLQQLESFAMTMDTMRDVELALPFLKSAPRVQNLTFIVFEQFRAGSALTLIASCLETLKQLTLTIYMDETFAEALSGICGPLQEIVSKSRVEFLDFTIFIDEARVRHGVDEWNELEKALLAPGWSYLKRVDLAVHLQSRELSGSFKEALKKLEDVAEKHLGRLVASKSFEFNLDVDSGEDDDDSDDDDDDYDENR